MKKYLELSLVLALVALPALAQDKEIFTGAPEAPVAPSNGPIWDAPAGGAVLIDNGPLVTSTGTGAGGADESVLQSTSLNMVLLGFGHQALNDNRVADDFVLDADSTLDSCTFFAYQTGSTTVSTMTAVNVQIWDGVPGGMGSSVIFGYMTTNLLTDTAFSNIYRVSETTLGANNRPLMANTVDFGGLNLAAGTYWFDWQTDGTLGSGPWAPPVTIVGNINSGDGLQSVDGGVTYQAAIDVDQFGGGSMGTQGFPFICTGSSAAAGGLPIPTLDWRGLLLMLTALSAAAFFMMRRRTANVA